MVPPEVGILYRWESEDLSVFKSAQNMTAVELREFITPTITMAHSQSQGLSGEHFLGSEKSKNRSFEGLITN
jgi:hypothetical protein